MVIWSCTVGKVSYYETAERPVVVRDLDEVLLALYNVPPERWPVYLQACRDSRQKGWWESYGTDTLPSWFSLFVGLEQGAAQLRMTRQAVLHREPDPLRLWAVLDEAVLRRVVGSPAIMRDQLRHLVAMARHPKITVQVVPFVNGAHPGMAAGRFEILGFPWPADPGVVYLEHRGGGLYLEQQHEIDTHTVAFEHLQVLALSPDESSVMIQNAAEEFS